MRLRLRIGVLLCALACSMAAPFLTVFLVDCRLSTVLLVSVACGLAALAVVVALYFHLNRRVRVWVPPLLAALWLGSSVLIVGKLWFQVGETVLGHVDGPGTRRYELTYDRYGTLRVSAR